jgi:hypothetical protein
MAINVSVQETPIIASIRTGFLIFTLFGRFWSLPDSEAARTNEKQVAESIRVAI